VSWRGKGGKSSKRFGKGFGKSICHFIGEVGCTSAEKALFSTSLSCKLKSIHFIQSLSSQFKIWCLSLYSFIYLFSISFSISKFNHLFNSSNSVPILFSFCRFIQAFFILVSYFIYHLLQCLCFKFVYNQFFFVQAFIENNTSIDLCCCLHEISELLYHLFKCLCFKCVYNQFIFFPSFYLEQHFNRSVLLLA